MTKPVLQVYKDVLSVRRSSRLGVRRSHRRARKVKKDRSMDNRKAVYDRDMGGYNSWGPLVRTTKNEVRQIKKEKVLVDRLRKRAKKMTPSGYAEDDFLASDDVKATKNTFSFVSDNLLDQADAESAESSSESEDELDSDLLEDDE